MTPQKINRRSARQQLQKQVEAALEQTAMGKGVPGICGGARPAQIRAGAKVYVDRAMKAIRNKAKACAVEEAAA